MVCEGRRWASTVSREKQERRGMRRKRSAFFPTVQCSSMHPQLEKRRETDSGWLLNNNNTKAVSSLEQEPCESLFSSLSSQQALSKRNMGSSLNRILRNPALNRMSRHTRHGKEETDLRTAEQLQERVKRNCWSSYYLWHQEREDTCSQKFQNQRIRIIVRQTKVSESFFTLSSSRGHRIQDLRCWN